MKTFEIILLGLIGIVLIAIMSLFYQEIDPESEDITSLILNILWTSYISVRAFNINVKKKG